MSNQQSVISTQRRLGAEHGGRSPREVPCTRGFLPQQEMQSRLATLVALVASVAALPAHKLNKKDAFLRTNNVSRQLEVRVPAGWSTDHQRLEHLKRALDHVPPALRMHGLHLEFGVRDGKTSASGANRRAVVRSPLSPRRVFGSNPRDAKVG